MAIGGVALEHGKELCLDLPERKPSLGGAGGDKCYTTQRCLA